MSRTVTIPTWKNPYEVEINNKIYSYKAGATVSVPDEVAEVIQRDIDEHTKEYVTLHQPRWGKGVRTNGSGYVQVDKKLEYDWDTSEMSVSMTPAEYQGMMASKDFVGKAYICNAETYELDTVLDVTKEQLTYDEERKILIGSGIPWVVTDCGEYATVSFSCFLEEPVIEKIPAEFVEQDADAKDAMDAAGKMAEIAYDGTAIPLAVNYEETHEVNGVTFHKMSDEVRPATTYRYGAITLYNGDDIGSSYGKSQKISESYYGCYLLCGHSLSSGNIGYPTVVMVNGETSSAEFNGFGFPSNGIWANWSDYGGSPFEVRPYASPNWTFQSHCTHCANEVPALAIGELGTTAVPDCGHCGY